MVIEKLWDSYTDAAMRVMPMRLTTDPRNWSYRKAQEIAEPGDSKCNA